ncbi:MAG: TonB-dependent receptor [Bacteroidota bacterium]|nr:TonB-dependent receptor [Bacteroidota bacterium]
MKNKILTSILLILSTVQLSAQDKVEAFRQTVRGTIIALETQQPIANAFVYIADVEPILSTKTDSMGTFSIINVPIGRHDIVIKAATYKSIVMKAYTINSGKQVVLNIEMQENVTSTEVEVKANKGQSLNDMAAVSARQFSVEETNRYAGSFGDPSRMAANYAGVQGANDTRNDIIIRGNSPAGLLWRLEGVDIPNPNHFSQQGTTGGPVSILNNNTLSNSDFFTGAFPAEYGNATSGAFDLRLRNGNNQKFEFTGQIGFNGVEGMAEGPFSKKSKASFLINYRYSVLGLFEFVGINLGPAGTPKYQDLTTKVNVPLGKGHSLQFFSIGGISSIAIFNSKRKKENSSYGLANSDIKYGTDMLAAGITYQHPVGKSGYFKHIFSYGVDRKRSSTETVRSTSSYLSFGDTTLYVRNAYHGIYNVRLNPKQNLRTGVIFTKINSDVRQQYFDTLYNKWIELTNIKGNSYLLQVYAQQKWRATNKMNVLGGVQYSQFMLNNTNVIDPRLGIQYQINDKNKLSFGYGLHGQIQQSYNYFYQSIVDTPSNTFIQTNKNLKFLRSHHFIGGYDLQIGQNMRFKSEAYYQYLYNIPVNLNPTSFSTINSGSDFLFVLEDSLVNNGIGSNVGIEFTFERFLNKGLYYLFTVSLFDSKYKASDGEWRNTAFNSNYVFNALAGKEYKIGKRSLLTVNLRVVWSGGRRYSPINYEETYKKNELVYDLDRAWSKRYPDYVKLDTRIGYKLQGKKITQEWALDVANTTNRKNVLNQVFDRNKGTVNTEYQLGILPVVTYRIQF